MKNTLLNLDIGKLTTCLDGMSHSYRPSSPLNVKPSFMSNELNDKHNFPEKTTSKIHLKCKHSVRNKRADCNIQYIQSFRNEHH